MMTHIEQVFLDILKASLVGAKAPAIAELSDVDRVALIQLASSHKVLPLIYEAGYAAISDPELRTVVRHQVMVQTMKSSEFMQLYRRLLDSGVHPIVVKGIVCRSMYPKPDHRISADEDILVSPAELEKARAVLEDFGMTTTEQDPDAYEYPYRKANSPLYIELHKSLFPAKNAAYGAWNDLFTHVFQDYDRVTIDGVEIFTMNPTDHLLYLILHALKHFMHSGFGIRQVCDMSMFANRYGKSIDWQRIYEVCDSVHGAYFAAAVFTIGSRYLNFDPIMAAYPQCWSSLSVDETEMLQDLLYGGIYGGSSASRMHSSNMTLDAVESNGKQGSGKASIWGSVFPSAAKLESRYPYLRKHPWMLPAAWCHRIISYGKETKTSSDGGALESVKIGTKRVELLRQYGVIK